MKRTMVTVVIPNYNGLRFMEDCFAALDLQVYRHFKVLVVDNGSTDGSVEWLKEQEIPAIFLPENGDFSGEKYGIFRGGECGDQGGGYALCDPVK